MPEWDDKKKKWIDWAGKEQSDVDLARAGRKEEYNYAMHNIGRYINKDLAPEVRAPLIAGLQQNLQEQYFGKKGLAADRIGQESNLGVAGIKASAARDVATITGKAQVEAYKGYGAEGDRITAESNMDALRLSRQDDGGDITDAGRSGSVALPGTQTTQIIDESVKPKTPRTGFVLPELFETRAFDQSVTKSNVSRGKKLYEDRKKKSKMYRELYGDIY